MKQSVRVRGWAAKREVLPLSFLRLVQSHRGLTLPQAKVVLDEFAEKGEVVVVFEDEAGAQEFAAAAAALGAECAFE